jgi:hypothetical protein
LNLRPLGYEPYDLCLWRLGQSLARVVTSTDRTDPISLCRLRLPRLVLSRRVRFTNRFTETAIDLQFPVPLRGCHPWVRGTVSGFANATATRLCIDVRHVASGRARRWAARRLSRHHRYRICAGAPTTPPAQTPPPNPTAAGPDDRRVLSRVGAADHAVTPQAPWTGSGWREHSDGGFGGGHPPFHRHTFYRQPDLHNLHYQLGKLCDPDCCAA